MKRLSSFRKRINKSQSCSKFESMEHLSHVNEKGNAAMVDVSEKSNTLRQATAVSEIIFPENLNLLFENNEYQSPKGPVFQTARIAGIQGVKQTSSLIPLCHPLTITGIDVQIEKTEKGAYVQCTVKTFGKTGVEMEALTGASVAALTIYDMCKAMSFEMEIGGIKLMEKSGGKSTYIAKS
jgi:cyclic pyranopterin phosphate synthase